MSSEVLVLISIIIGICGILLGTWANDVIEFRDKPALSLFLMLVAFLLVVVVSPFIMIQGLCYNGV